MTPTLNNTVVIVDDEPSILNSLKRALRQDGYQIHTFNRPYDALEMMREEEVAVIISDQCMPQLEGADFLHLIDNFQPSTLKIILSGYYNEHSISRLVEHSHAWRYLAKPWCDEELRSTVAEAMLRYNQLPAHPIRATL